MAKDLNTKPEPGEIKPKANYRGLVRNVVILASAVTVFMILFITIPDFNFTVRYVIDMLSHGDIEKIKWYLRSFGIWAPLVSAFIMIFSSVLAPLPSFFVTLTNGLLFGAFWGTLLSWSSAMAGAALCFYIARILGRPAAERFVSKKAMTRVDQFFDRYGNNSVLIARLIPIVSFDAVSYAAGLTSISFWGFFIATGIGQLPATIAYSWLGQNINGLARIGLYAFVGLVALTVLGFMLKRILEKRINDRERKTAETAE